MALGRNPTVSAGEQVVVVYVSEDQVFSEPILKDFERDTGITVKAVYDTEEAKSTGVMNRLLAEKRNPQADIYWANEPIRAEILKQRGISAPYVSPSAQGIPEMFKDPEGYWTGFSARARVLVVRAEVKDKPTSILAYTDAHWKNQAVMASPLFGTTTAHVAALFTVWGDERAKAFLQDLKANEVRISTSNGESADFVASGEAAFALVDSDDGASRLAQGKSIEVVYPDQGAQDIGCLLMPNAVLLIKGAPHTENARKLIDYLLSNETERKLAFAACAQLPLHRSVETPPTVQRIETLKLMFLTMASLQSVNPRLEEAGRLVSGWFGMLTGISLPIALPGILLSAILVFLLSLGEFNIPMFLRYQVFSVESFTQFSAFHEVGAATASATLLAFITLFILVVERQYVRKPFASLQPTSDRRATVPIALGPLRAWWLMLVCLLCGVLVIVPLLVLVMQSASPSAYVEAFARAGDSLLRSVGYAALGASALTMLGFFLGYFITRRRLPFWQALDFLTIALLTLPSTVIGVALVTLWNRPATILIYATPLIVLFGYLAQYTALTSRITVAALNQIPASMEEAAAVVGAGWLRRVACVLAPLAKRGLVAGWLVGYLFCLRDTGITMMVYPPGGETLPVRTFTLMANSPPPLIAALCLIMMMATLIPLGLLNGLAKPMRLAR